MIWATVSSRSCFCWLYRASPFCGRKEYDQSDFSVDHLVMSMCRVSSCVVGRGCLLWPVRSLGKTVSLCPASFCTPRPNLPVNSRCLLPSYFSIPVPMMKRTSLGVLVLALISHTSKVMLKILQAGLQQYVNHELPHVQAGFRKGRGTRDQIANINWIIEAAREFNRSISFCFTDYAKASDCLDHNKLRKILQEMGIPDHLTCLLRNLYASQKATVRSGHEQDWFQTGKGVMSRLGFVIMFV